MSKEISKREIVRKRGKERDSKKGRNKSVSFNKEAEKRERSEAERAKEIKL